MHKLYSVPTAITITIRHLLEWESYYEMELFSDRFEEIPLASLPSPPIFHVTIIIVYREIFGMPMGTSTIQGELHFNSS